MTKKKEKPEDDAAIARDVAQGLELVELSVEWALRRVKEPNCTAAERKKFGRSCSGWLIRLMGSEGSSLIAARPEHREFGHGWGR